MGKGSLTIKAVCCCVVATTEAVVCGAVTCFSCPVTFGDDFDSKDFNESKPSKDNEVEAKGLATLMFRFESLDLFSSAPLGPATAALPCMLSEGRKET